MNNKTAAESATEVISDLIGTGAATSILDPIDKNADVLLASIQPRFDQFNPFRVEPLLEQTAALLDRCVRYNAQKQALEEKALTYALEHAEKTELSAVLDDEVRAGRFSLPAELAQFDEAAQAMRYARSHEARDYLQILAAKTSASHPYARRRIDVFALLAYFNAEWATTQTQDQIKDLGSERETISLWHEETGVLANLKQAEASESVANGDLNSAKARRTYEDQNVGFQGRRKRISESFVAQRYALSQSPGGALNFAERAAHLTKLYEADIAEAYVRMLSLAAGVKEVFGQIRPVPAPTPVGFLASAVVWTQWLVNTLMRFADWSDEYVHVVSLRHGSLSQSQWSASLQSGNFSVNVPASLFPDQLFVRLRGVNLAIRGSVTHAIWRARVKIPVSADTLHLEEGTNAPVIVRIDQSHIPSIRLGDVSERRPGERRMAIYGDAALNASPVGTWEIELYEPSSGGDLRVDTIDDLLLELYMVTAHFR